MRVATLCRVGRAALVSLGHDNAEQRRFIAHGIGQGAAEGHRIMCSRQEADMLSQIVSTARLVSRR